MRCFHRSGPGRPQQLKRGRAEREMPVAAQGCTAAGFAGMPRGARLAVDGSRAFAAVSAEVIIESSPCQESSDHADAFLAENWQGSIG